MILHARLALMLALLSAAGLVGVAAVAAAPVSAAPVSAAPVNSVEPDHPGAQVKLNEDVVVAPNQLVGAVVAVHGDVVVAGTVNGSIVAIGGDVTLLPTAVVYGGVTAVGGRVERSAGAFVRGNVTAIGFGSLRKALRRFVGDPISHPFTPGTLAGWLATTALYVLVAIIACVTIPRSVVAVRERIATRPLRSLGWGALGLLVFVPLGTIVLGATIIGFVLLIPGLVVVVPCAFFFGYVCLGALAGGRLLKATGYRGDGLLPAAIVGVVLVHLLRLIPIVGTVVWLLIWLVGFGATYVAAFDHWRVWRRRSRGGSPASAAESS